MKNLIVTHSGSFHADEIFATALIKKFITKNIEVVRTRDESLLFQYTNDPCVWVVDVGRSYNEKLKNFDHHQATFDKTWPNGDIPYSSCGLVWLYLRKKGYIGKKYSYEVIKTVEERLIKRIDMHDNRIATWPQSIVFKLCNREVNTVDDFLRALGVAEIHLEDTFRSAEELEKNRHKVKDIEFCLDGSVAILDNETHNIIAPISKETSAKIIIMPKGGDGTWSVRSIGRPHENILTPEEWRGLSGKELQDLAGIRKLIFVHKAGFLAIVKNRKTAIDVARVMLLGQKK